MEWWTALTIGVLGSFHCVGMCGPIAMALPYQADRPGTTLFISSLYNGGRVAGYAMIGLFFGLIGQSFSMVGLQKALSIGIGILILLVVVWPRVQRSSHIIEDGLKRIYTPLQRRMGIMLANFSQSHRQGASRWMPSLTLLGIGFTNAFIPCGLVYLAVAGAVTQGQFSYGIIYMALFGLGTVPLMLALGLSHHLIRPKTRSVIRRARPYIMLFFACLFILRGLNVDLPVNLSFWIDQGTPPMCH